MKKQPSTKGKGTIRKILGSPVIDPDPKNRKPKNKPIKKQILKAPSREEAKAAMKKAMSPANVAKKIASAGVSRSPLTSIPKVPKPPRTEPRTPPPSPSPGSKAVPNLDPAMLAKVRSKLQQESIRRGSSNSSKPVAKKTSGSSSAGGSQKDQPSEVSKVKKKFKGPGMKDGGSVKAYKAGGTVSKSKATGAAKRGFGKAYMKGKR